MKLLQNLFGKGGSNELAELEALFAGVSGADVKYLACFSLLLAKVADADNKVTDGELARIKELLIEHAGLSPDKAAVVSTTALKTSLAKSLDLKAICDELNACSTQEQRREAMISCLNVASDDGISETEIQRMHAIARMLGFAFKEWKSILAEFNGTDAEQAS
jgi:uncharacterized tellurite resistance protein B-like protein